MKIKEIVKISPPRSEGGDTWIEIKGDGGKIRKCPLRDPGVAAKLDGTGMYETHWKKDGEYWNICDLKKATNQTPQAPAGAQSVASHSTPGAARPLDPNVVLDKKTYGARACLEFASQVVNGKMFEGTKAKKETVHAAMVELSKDLMLTFAGFVNSKGGKPRLQIKTFVPLDPKEEFVGEGDRKRYVCKDQDGAFYYSWSSTVYTGIKAIAEQDKSGSFTFEDGQYGRRIEELGEA